MELTGDRPWGVTSRRIITRLAVSREMSPFLVPEIRVEINAECPYGHELPFKVTADEAVVCACEGSGTMIYCRRCDTNYVLDFGSWD
jgi:hypothetical protein